MVCSVGAGSGRRELDLADQLSAVSNNRVHVGTILFDLHQQTKERTPIKYRPKTD
jgi:hypothetical protein